MNIENTLVETQSASSVSHAKLMTTEILISNIGNRNLLYKDALIGPEFRTLTQVYLSNYDKERSHFKEQILTKHITPKTGAIYLLTTDQGESNFNQKDTLFEGEILKKLLEEQYNVPVHLLTYKGNPTDENALAKSFSEFIKKIAQAHPDSKFVYNDAGGTSAMKLAIRELIQYYLKDNQYHFVYASADDSVTKIDRSYLNRYLVLKLARQFVHNYNYSAALDVLATLSAGATVTTRLKDSLRTAKYRLNFQHKDAVQALQKTANSLPGIFQSFLQAKIPAGAVPFPDFQKAENRQSIFEVASICQLYFNNKEYTLAIATFYRLCEEICQNYIEEKLEINMSNEDGKTAFIDSIDFSKIQQKFPGLTRLQRGIPIMMAYILTDPASSQELKKFMELLAPTCFPINNQTKGRGLNMLRNRCFLAHNNEPVTLKSINDAVPDFMNGIQLKDQIFGALGLPEDNIYKKMNHELEKMFLME